MLTREELLNYIERRKRLFRLSVIKLNEFTDVLEDSKALTYRNIYDSVYDTLETANAELTPLVGTYASDMQTLKNKIAYYDNLLKVQYNGDLDHGIESLIEMFTDNKNAHKEMLRLYTILYSLTIKCIENTSKLKVLTNKIYQKSYDSSLQGSIIRQQWDALDAAAAAEDALNAAAAAAAPAEDALDAAYEKPPTLKEHLKSLKKSYKNVYKGGKTHKRKSKRKH